MPGIGHFVQEKTNKKATHLIFLKIKEVSTVITAKSGNLLSQLKYSIILTQVRNMNEYYNCSAENNIYLIKFYVGTRINTFKKGYQKHPIDSRLVPFGIPLALHKTQLGHALLESTLETKTFQVFLETGLFCNLKKKHLLYDKLHLLDLLNDQEQPSQPIHLG